MKGGYLGHHPPSRARLGSACQGSACSSCWSFSPGLEQAWPEAQQGAAAFSCHPGCVQQPLQPCWVWRWVNPPLPSSLAPLPSSLAPDVPQITRCLPFSRFCVLFAIHGSAGGSQCKAGCPRRVRSCSVQLPVIFANPGDVLFPLDDHGAVQSQPQEFHFYGEDL